jgi:hypothetical protein
LPRYSAKLGLSAALPAPLAPRSASQPRVKTPPPRRVDVPPDPGTELDEPTSPAEGIEGIDELLAPPPSAAASAPVAPKGNKPQAPTPAAAPPSSTPATAPTPWVKPEWARPDDEPKKSNDDDPYP